MSAVLDAYLATFTPYPDVAEESYQEKRISWHAERERTGAALMAELGGIGAVVRATLRGGRRVIGVLAADMQIWHGEIACQHKRPADDLGTNWTLVKPAKVADMCYLASVEPVTDADTLSKWARASAIVVAAGGRHGGHRGWLAVP